jgi:hypothetical protein
VAKKVAVATKLAGEPELVPPRPFPEVQPPAVFAPKPIRRPPSVRPIPVARPPWCGKSCASQPYPPWAKRPAATACRRPPPARPTRKKLFQPSWRARPRCALDELGVAAEDADSLVEREPQPDDDGAEDQAAEPPGRRAVEASRGRQSTRLFAGCLHRDPLRAPAVELRVEDPLARPGW